MTRVVLLGLAACWTGSTPPRPEPTAGSAIEAKPPSLVDGCCVARDGERAGRLHCDSVEAITWYRSPALPPPPQGSVYFDTDQGSYRSLMMRLNTELAGSPEDFKMTLHGIAAEAVAFVGFEPPNEGKPLGVVARVKNPDGTADVVQCWDHTGAENRLELCRAAFERIDRELITTSTMIDTCGGDSSRG